MEITVVRHIGQVVTDVLSGAGDPEGDVAVGQKSAAGVEVCMGADSRSGKPVRRGRLSDAGVGMGCSYRLIEPALWSMLPGGHRSAGTGSAQFRDRCARCASVESKPVVCLGELQA
jgi:hypothetical protein